MLEIDHEKIELQLAVSSLSIEKLAELSGVSRSSISCIVNGKTKKVRPQTIGKIANSLNVQVETLLKKE